MTEWTPEITLIIPNRIELLTPVLDALESFCLRFGGDPALSQKLRLVAEETVVNAIHHAYLPEESGQIEVQASWSGERIHLSVLDRGLPLDPERLETTKPSESQDETDKLELSPHLGSTLVRQLCDRVEWASLGNDGKRVKLELSAPALTPSADSGHKEELLLKAPREAISLRLMAPSEAEQVSQLCYRAYRLSYPNSDFYNPGQVLKLNQQKRIHSYVAVHDDGVVAGHTALMKDELVQGALEVGQVMVRHEFRGLQLANRMIDQAVEDCLSRHLQGCFAHAVTAHPLSQKALSRAGLQSTGCLLSYARGELFESELATTDLQRESTLLMYRSHPSQVNERVTVHGGPRLRPFADLASEATNQVWKLERGQSRSSLPTESQLSVHEVPALGTAMLIWHTLGQDLLKTWKRTWEGLLSHGMATAIVLIDWQNPGCELVCEALFREGLVPVGTLPGFAFARPLMLTKLAPQTFDIDKLQISCPVGLKLREAIAPWLKA